MLKITLTTGAVGPMTLVYRYEFSGGEGIFDQDIPRAELETAGIWALFIWPEGTGAPDGIKPNVTYQLARTAQDGAIRQALQRILKPRRDAAAREAVQYTRVYELPLG